MLLSPPLALLLLAIAQSVAMDVGPSNSQVKSFIDAQGRDCIDLTDLASVSSDITISLILLHSGDKGYVNLFTGPQDGVRCYSRKEWDELSTFTNRDGTHCVEIITGKKYGGWEYYVDLKAIPSTSPDQKLLRRPVVCMDPGLLREVFVQKGPFNSLDLVDIVEVHSAPIRQHSQTPHEQPVDGTAVVPVHQIGSASEQYVPEMQEDPIGTTASQSTSIQAAAQGINLPKIIVEQLSRNLIVHLPELEGNKVYGIGFKHTSPSRARTLSAIIGSFQVDLKPPSHRLKTVSDSEDEMQVSTLWPTLEAMLGPNEVGIYFDDWLEYAELSKAWRRTFSEGPQFSEFILVGIPSEDSILKLARNRMGAISCMWIQNDRTAEAFVNRQLVNFNVIQIDP